MVAEGPTDGKSSCTSVRERLEHGNVGQSNATARDFVAAREEGYDRTLRVRRTLVGAEALDLVEDVRRLRLDDVVRLRLSLRHVERVDVSGVAAIVRVFAYLVRQGKSLSLVDAEPAVCEALTDLGLGGVVAISPRDVAHRTAGDLEGGFAPVSHGRSPSR